MGGYIGNIPVPQGTQTRQNFTATASQTSFSTIGYTAGFIDVYLNGVKLINGTDFTATNGSDVVLASAASASDVLDVVIFDTFNTSSGTFSDTTLKNNVTLKNDTEEDSDGGRASKIIYQGEQSGGEISTLAEIQASHDGTADDQKGDLIFKTNDGSDNATPTERLRIESDGKTKFITANDTAGTSKSLTFGTMAFNRAEIRVTNAATYDGSLEFYTGNASNFAERWRITKDGHFKAATNGNGIDFSHTEGSGASSSILDDYEEGTFTPTFGSVAAPTYSSQAGKYTKVGNLVHCTVSIDVSTGLDTSDASAVTITSLPFTAVSSEEVTLAALGRYINLLGSKGTSVHNFRQTSASVLLYQGNDAPIRYNNINSGGFLQIAFTYRTA